MKLIESKTYLVGFKFKNDKVISTWRAIEGETISDVVKIAEEYANKYRYIISVIKENDTPTLRSSTKTINIDI